ncbi:uncharacterized protein BT62DRAFT_938154 [Guyanagaster necrorhizus]|uniref:Uncharacterized protein n=1 Tax=Guyanagaster necrorhizus TaxID=856835 RepID=A0A9P7VG50_9AGAR|nr:uncharacterized protein BT62DRAFT_938154 [Guyanagaster necrorhizus MCA 3950]KAG7440341.1 hypothetical protein BT62DRAFT_938154 [Guyanagaster necrorhizus MCA 3950]
MPRCMRVTLFPAPQSNWQPEVTLEALSEPELVNLDGPQGLSPIWYAPPGPPRTPDADIDPPQLTKMEITRIRYRTGGRPREEYEMTEEELSDMFAGTNIHTERGYELGSSSSDGSPANTSGPEHREFA